MPWRLNAAEAQELEDRVLAQLRADAADMIDAFPHWLRPETGVLKAIVGF